MSDWTLVGTPALLVVHMQNAICKTPSPLEALGHGRAAWKEGVVANIQSLISAFRAHGHLVAYCVAYTPSEVTWPAYGAFWNGSKAVRVNHMGTWDVEVIDELAPAPGEHIFYNWPFNVFEGTGLHEYLQEQGVDSVVLTGVATGMSVGTAAWALAERFYNLVVPADASTDGNPHIHKAVTELILPAIGLVTTTRDVIEHL